MTNKPERLFLKENKEEKFAYKKRMTEEQEAREALKDFLRHQEEERDAPSNSIP